MNYTPAVGKYIWNIIIYIQSIKIKSLNDITLYKKKLLQKLDIFPYSIMVLFIY